MYLLTASSVEILMPTLGAQWKQTAITTTLSLAWKRSFSAKMRRLRSKSRRHAVYCPPLETQQTLKGKSTVQAATSRKGRGANVFGQESALRACSLSITST